MPSQSQPLVSCLMVTRDRAELATRAIECFARQTWRNKELVIVDDGNEDYTPSFAKYEKDFTIRYCRFDENPALKLGGIRNLSLDEARGEYCIQWDDDEWYHPERIERQMAPLRGRFRASVLRHTLMHVPKEPFSGRPFRTSLPFGTPGTICHRRTTHRYPNLSKAEDTIFLRHFIARGQVRVLNASNSHLFMRCYHGGNTWDFGHFAERLKRGPVNRLHALRLQLLGRPITDHPLFHLTAAEQRTYEDFNAFEAERLAG